MRVLVIDNSVHTQILREGLWTGRILDSLDKEHELVSGVYDKPALDQDRHSHVILTGSEASITDNDPWIVRQVELVERAAKAGVPILGICFGHQLIARTLAGIQAVGAMPEPEFGWLPISVTGNKGLLQGLADPFTSLLTHFDRVSDPGPDFRLLARTDACGVQAMSHRELPIHGIQFHPEIAAADGNMLLTAIKALKPTLRLDLIKAYAASGKYDPSVGTTIFRNFFSMSEDARRS